MVARGATYYVLLVGGNVVLNFALSFMLVRLLGTAAYGAYVYALTWAVLLSIPARLGCDTLVVRFVSVYQAQGQWGHLRGLLIRAYQVALGGSLALSAVASAVLLLWLAPDASDMYGTVLMALMIVPLHTTHQITASALLSLRRTVASQSPGLILHPLMVIAASYAAYLAIGSAMTATDVVFVHAGASAVVLLVGLCLLARFVPVEARHAKTTYLTREWRKVALPLFAADAINHANEYADRLILGAMLGGNALGVYHVVSRYSNLTVLPKNAVAMTTAPRIAALHSAGDREGLKRVVNMAALAVTVLALGIVLVYMAFGHWLLELFGKDFLVGQSALLVLAIAHLIQSASGSARNLLKMTGNEWALARVVAIGGVANIALNLALIPIWGLLGAALATAIAVVLTNGVLAVWFVVQRLNLDPTIFGVFSTWRGFGAKPKASESVPS